MGLSIFIKVEGSGLSSMVRDFTKARNIEVSILGPVNSSFRYKVGVGTLISTTWYKHDDFTRSARHFGILVHSTQC
jgi:hypothetical protein